MKVRVIAFYLPQYHPTVDNDEWWGKGFTEWTNVGKAKSLFKGHYQPKVPADLGYYDLRLSEAREAQAELAREAGIEGFCYYHYWFGNGKQELERPFNEVLSLGKPDFPFCLCWANESWHSKFWNKDGTIEKKMLVEQTYVSEKDHIDHFYSLLPAFKDLRYIRLHDKPLFMIYKPFDFPGINEFIDLWNRLAVENGLKGIYFIAQLASDINIKAVEKGLSLGFNAINTVGLWDARLNRSLFNRVLDKIRSKVLGVPYARRYQDVYPRFLSEVDRIKYVYPTLIPNWDHTPRSGSAGYLLLESAPELFKKHVKEALLMIENKAMEDQVLFLKSWNEWGEGNYMEPDLKYGKGYINALKEILEEQ